MTNGRSIAETPPIYAEMLALCHLVFLIAGVSASFYVYLRFTRHAAALGSCQERLPSFIFAVPIIQAVITLVLSLQAIFWKAVIRRQARRKAEFIAQDPSLAKVDRVVAFKLVVLGCLFAGAILFGMTIYRCVLVATNGVCT